MEIMCVARADDPLMGTKVWGVPKRAITDVRVLNTAKVPRSSVREGSTDKAIVEIAMVACRIRTGVTHQIRQAVAHLGCPVVGACVVCAQCAVRASYLTYLDALCSTLQTSVGLSLSLITVA
jgi:23S rRNA-/tRNA-specific pseudouridylate synthase